MSKEPRTLTCKSCDSDFQHIQNGRGRPPVYCPSCKASKAKPATPSETTEAAPVSNRPVYEGTPEPGDTAILPAFHMFSTKDSAYRNATKVTVSSIDMEKDIAYVKHPSEKFPITTKLSRLLKVSYPLALN